MKNLIVSIALILATSTSVLAQSAAPVAPAAPKAPVTMPAAPLAPATPVVKAPVVVAPAPVTQTPMAKSTAAQAKTSPVNLNTATVEQLDALPQIGPARAKAIVEARTKAKFKDWSDFTTRNVVPSNAEASIKDRVVF